MTVYAVIPFRFIAGGLHPDHSTIAWFRKQFLVEAQEVFAQVLLIAHEMGYLRLDNISLDGSKVHADASKSKAVSVQVAVDQDSLFIVGNTLSNHPVDTYLDQHRIRRAP